MPRQGRKGSPSQDGTVRPQGRICLNFLSQGGLFLFLKENKEKIPNHLTGEEPSSCKKL